jgi:hypothetical protein
MVSRTQELVLANSRAFVGACVSGCAREAHSRAPQLLPKRALRALGVMLKNEHKAAHPMDLKVGNTSVTGFLCTGSVTRNTVLIRPNVDECALAEAACVPSAHPLKLD